MAGSAMKLGIIMDPIAEISPKKDTSLAMLLEAARRNYDSRISNSETCGSRTESPTAGNEASA